jgi:hypothetical protein
VGTRLSCTLLVTVLGTGLVHAQGSPERERTAFEAGVGAGIGFPVGQLSSGKNLSDWVGLTFPLTFELGARLFGRYELIAVGQYSIGTVNSTSGSGCYTGNNACSASIGQIGVEFLYHPLGLARVDPYVGVGLGYEWLVIRATVQGKNYDQSFGGGNWAVLQSGVDFSLGSVVHLGPFLLASIGQYQTSNYTVPTAGGPQSGSSAVEHPAIHVWLSVGLRLMIIP